MFSFEPVENCQHAADVVLRLPIGWDAAMPLHRLGARVVGGQSKSSVPKAGQHHQEIPSRPVEVLLPVVGIDAGDWPPSLA